MKNKTIYNINSRSRIVMKEIEFEDGMETKEYCLQYRVKKHKWKEVSSILADTYDLIYLGPPGCKEVHNDVDDMNLLIKMLINKRISIVNSNRPIWLKKRKLLQVN